MGCIVETCENDNIVGCKGRIRCKCLRKMCRRVKMIFCCCFY